MKTKAVSVLFFAGLVLSLAQGHGFTAGAEEAPAGRVLKTPLPPKVLDILSDEISGQLAYNNEVLLAGTMSLRDEKELSGTFAETQKLFDLARGYGLDNAKILRFPRDSRFDYALEGELWLVKPQTRRIARLEADAALVAGGSSSVDTTAELVYIPPLRDDQVQAWLKAGPRPECQGKVALMWSHPERDEARALDTAGLAGVVAFQSQDRYFDPDQVIFSGGPYSQMKNMKFGMTVSWRQWSELLEDAERGESPTVRCRVAVKSYSDRVEGVLAWIPGAEPQGKGIIFTAHLFEGYAKRGSNDNMSGCAAELEIFRALTTLIKQGALPPPRRTISFLWTNEIGGTFEYIKHNPGLAASLSANINMDMVGEGLRRHNAVFILTEATSPLPTYMDGLGRSILNFLWRTNDIVYLPDSPRAGRNEQVFPRPLWEKNGSRDAFRFDVQSATGGSDHICFANPSTAVPAVSFNIWPDQWYHTDADVPDKSDPTQLKRAAFAGAAMAWAAANCTDDILPGLAESVEEFAFSRMAKNEIPAALELIQKSEAAGLGRAWRLAENLIALGVERELGALEAIGDISTGSEASRRLLADTGAQWKQYGQGLETLLRKSAELRARRLKQPLPSPLPRTAIEKKYGTLVPSLTENVKGQEFRVEGSPSYRNYIKIHPEALKDLELEFFERRAILDYINGRRSVTAIRDRAESETSKDIPLDKVVRYLDVLKSIGWIVYLRTERP